MSLLVTTKLFTYSEKKFLSNLDLRNSGGYILAFSELLSGVSNTSQSFES